MFPNTFRTAWEVDFNKHGPCSKGGCYLDRISELSQDLFGLRYQEGLLPFHTLCGVLIARVEWFAVGRTDAEAEAPVLWPPDAKS